MPNVTPLEFEKTTVPDVAVCVPAARAPGAVLCVAEKLAVTVPAFMPNETEFEFEKTIVPELALVVPALIAAGAVLCE